MFKKLSITPCEDITIRELLDLIKMGYCVSRTSHAGNWSLYKLLMSQLGIPDCIWDVTCIYRDINNQPRHQLIGRKKISLLSGVPEQPATKAKYLTPYYRPSQNPEITLAHFHVKPLKELFGDSITTQSQVLLEFKESLQIVFEIVQNHRPELLGRYVLPCGCMVELKMSSGSYKASCSHGSYAELYQKDLAESGMQTLEELQRLVLNPEGYIQKGGVIYSFELVVASYYLWAYWKFGDKTIYELSGPDMMRYATKSDFINRIEQVLKLIGQHAPVGLIPDHIDSKIVPATRFRFGYPDNCTISKTVTAAHEIVRRIQPLRREFKDVASVAEFLNEPLKKAIEIIEKQGSHWNLFHDPSIDAFYSQHDMVATGANMIIQDQYLDMSFRAMGSVLTSLSQSEQSLKRQFFSQIKS